MSVYMTNPKYELIASAAYTTNPDAPDDAVTLAINKCGKIVACRNNANDVEIVEGLLRVCHDDEALIEAAKAFAEELDAVGYEGYAKWIRMEIKQAEKEMRKYVHIEISTMYGEYSSVEYIYTKSKDGEIDVEENRFGDRLLNERVSDIADEYRNKALEEAEKVEYSDQELVHLFEDECEGYLVSAYVTFDEE